jgi:hypothetical protein
MRKRLLLLLLAALVIGVLLLYPSTQCRVTGADLTASPVQTWVIPVDQGYAVGFTFNITNHSNCEVNAQKITVHLRSILYADGTEVAQNSEESESMAGALGPGQTGTFSYTLNSYSMYRPVKILLRIEVAFAETGSIPILDVELVISK